MTSNKKILQGSGLDDQTENEFYRKFNHEFNGLRGKKLDCHFIRRKDLPQLHEKADYLIVRAPFRRSEKLLTALAKGIWILPEAFIRKVIKDEKWHEVKEFDIGNVGYDRNPDQTELHFPLYIKRFTLKKNGGIFRNECAVVLLKEVGLKERFQRILAAGGAKTLSRTVQHLVDR